MSVLQQLACALGRRDELPNQELGRKLAAAHDSNGVGELAENLSNKDGAIQADCIKVLYEVGYLEPELIAPYALDFLKLLKSRNNRLVWGGMIALSTVAVLAADVLYPHWSDIRRAMEFGSVITKDAGVLTLARVASASATYEREIFPCLLEHLRTCRPKDVPQHSEKTLPAVTADNKAAFIAVLEKRLEDMQGAGAARLKRVIRQAGERSL